MTLVDSYKEVLIVTLGGSIVFLALTGIVIFVLLFYQKKKFQHVRQLMHVEKLHTEALLRSELEIKEETFKSISQEIHDNIGQVLSLIKLTLSSINTPEKEADKEKLLRSITLLSRSIQDLRDIAKGINTDFIHEIGLGNAIKQQLQLLEKTGKYITHFVQENGEERLEAKYEFILFRIVQELLNNIVKHAKASSIDVTIDQNTERIVITVADNGHGFDPKAITTKNGQKGLGLNNMRDRIQLIKGQLLADSSPGKGTRIRLELPKLRI